MTPEFHRQENPLHCRLTTSSRRTLQFGQNHPVQRLPARPNPRPLPRRLPRPPIPHRPHHLRWRPRPLSQQHSSFRIPNLQSTRFLTALALPRLIPIHFLSSNRVTLLSGSTSLSPISVASYPPPGDGSEGYTASIWASERFLENVATAVPGLDICIHRPCAVTGARAPSEDAGKRARSRFTSARFGRSRWRSGSGARGSWESKRSSRPTSRRLCRGRSRSRFRSLVLG